MESSPLLDYRNWNRFHEQVPSNPLDHQTLNLVLDSKDLRLEVTGIVGGDADSNHGTRDTGGSAEGKFAGNVAVGDVLVLTIKHQNYQPSCKTKRSRKEGHVPEQGQVQQNSQRGGISSEDDDLRCSAVEGFCRFVSALLQLLVVGSLLDDIEDILGEGFVGDGPGYFHSKLGSSDLEMWEIKGKKRLTCVRFSGHYGNGSRQRITAFCTW